MPRLPDSSLPPLPPLPIDEVLPRLLSALEDSSNVVLSAPPGAGKTTRVPLALLDAPWLAGGNVLMLEPRRLAARRAASYMATVLGERVGETVGYRIRGDSVVGRATRVEVVTEGILTRMLHASPDLPGVGALLFDEFHERSIHADLGLALSLDVQEQIRPDLRILVMSATLDGVSLSRVLRDAPVVEGKGRSHPVETRYLRHPFETTVERETARVVRKALGETEGDILVFLPGIREIRRVEAILGDEPLPPGAGVRVLYGDADEETQRRALEPAGEGRRKILLATSIAETSLTIGGVRVVVDAGLARVPRFDPRRGMTGLVTVPVSVASADQRRGRAGRQGPGTCYRLWTEEQHAALPGFSTPEILSADIAPLALDIARWGGGGGLRFIDPPPPAHLAQARALLAMLGALDPKGKLTQHGKAIADIPVHPRLAHMILRGKEMSLGRLACDIGALLGERDILAGGGRKEIDIADRVDALRTGRGTDESARARVRAESLRLQEMAGARGGRSDVARAGLLVALAYPERVARRRGGSPGRYRMASGTGAVLPEWSLLSREEYLAVADVDGAGAEVGVFLAARIERDEILEAFGDELIVEEQIYWDQRDQSVVARGIRRLGAIALDERPLDPRAAGVTGAMMEGIRLMGLGSLPWDRGSLSVKARSEWLRRGGFAAAGWPALDDDHLLATLGEWLGAFLSGMTRRDHLRRLDMDAVMRARFTHAQWQELSRMAPEAIAVPTGSRIRLEYAPGEIPVLAVRLQEMFGQTDTPAVAGGRARVLLHLLSPAGRPLAVTQDLRSFWLNTYPVLRGEMRAKYPRHVWPEDPLAASPTRRTRPKRGSR